MPVQPFNPVGILAGLAEQLGPRRATSTAEAVAAAQINARLRQAGFSVDTRSLPAVDHPGVRFRPVAVWLIAVTVLSGWLPVAGIVLVLWLVAVLCADALATPLPVLRRQRMSQNIIAALPIAVTDIDKPSQPRWRLVIVAPLDTPPAWRGISHLIAPTTEGLLIRLVFTSLPLVSATTAAWTIWQWSLLIVALLGAIGWLWATYRPIELMEPDGGIAALAALLIAGHHLHGLRHVEVWAVTIGAAYCDQHGIKTLLTRYPFDPRNTFVIGLGPLACGQLAIISRDGVLRHERADQFLYQLAMMADQTDPVIDLEPRTLAVRDELLAPFRQRHFRTLSIRAIADSRYEYDPSLAERAARLIGAIARALDNEPER
ncbi:MAG: hypothetical protein C0184_08780 [Chloroflexus aggregans]|uniref:Uncharacterized protein n=1 Tax=Chloroflexus aggregans TaxID=152260 RepID=A0A2J6X427_9CHLR|nr:MAG: hypothetical protein C0184_08780 [Chloroflexus aggregans]